MTSLQELDDGLGARMRTERERLGMTQADLAAVASSTASQIGLYERGKHRCPAFLLEVLAMKGADAEYLLTGSRTVGRKDHEDMAAAGLAVLKTLPAFKGNAQLAQALQMIETTLEKREEEKQLTEEENTLLMAFRSASAKQKAAVLAVVAALQG